MISIIVPARNAYKTLPVCLDSLNDQTLPRNEYEVIVVDDGSGDETAQIAEKFGAICVRLAPSGPAAARNAGARQARGEILFFTDADCIAARDWAQCLLKAFDEASVMGAKGIYKTKERGAMPRFVQVEYESKYARMSRMQSIDFIDTYSAAYRRELFLANGGFDTHYPAPSVEDQEFSFRLARQGHRLVFAPTAIVYHRHDLNLLEYIQRKFWIGYWKVFLLRRHPDKAIQDSHTPFSQRLQILLMGAIIFLAMFSFIIPILWYAAMAALAIFFVSTLPFLIFIAQHDPALLIAAPFFIVVRALALGAGLFTGFLMTFLKRADV